jgi:two-component system, cell cycle sensor histidine kinase and response regulator CckA
MQIEHSEFQDQLVRGLAHRMNNILTLFHGYLGLLLDNKELDRETLDGLNRIKEGAKAASELMDRTHSLVRPSAMVWREINLGGFVQLLRPGFELFRGPNTVLEFECPEDLPCVWGDMSRVRTAISELVRNACEATANGGLVRVELRAEEPPAVTSSATQPIQWVSLTVTDDGPGIPPGLTERVFAPFFSSKQKQNNAGLGLTVALGFVQQLGGVIRVRSEPGNTAFQVLLPSRTGQPMISGRSKQ